ncbi:MAG: SGNH/GDSL hydrolase family protein [Gemmatimonadaceae bacterium]
MVTQAPNPPQAEVRFLALGDSYTIGESVRESERWPMQLTEMLRHRGVRVADPTVIAKTGWTTDELSAGIDAALPQGKFDLVTLSIGVNNQYRGRSVDEYREQFRALLGRAVRFAGGNASHVIVVSIPDWSVTPFAVKSGRDRAKISSEVDAFNTVAKEEAARGGATYVDVTPVSRRAATDAAQIAGDGLHPSGAMYAAWTDLIFPAAAAILRVSK